MRTMDLDDLHIFRCVVREGGVTRAADRLHRVPSNVTTRIKQFEERLGVALFRRQGRGLFLTDAGRTLLGHAERLLQMPTRPSGSCEAASCGACCGWAPWSALQARDCRRCC